MIIYVAIITACTTPVSMTCQSLVKPESFYEESACVADLQEMQEQLTRKGILNSGQCVKIKAGSDT